MKHPIQPIVRDERGVVRFQANQIVRILLDTGVLDMNRLAAMDFDADDRMQLAMLIGYSVSGFGDLSYTDPEIVALANKMVELGAVSGG